MTEQVNDRDRAAQNAIFDELVEDSLKKISKKNQGEWALKKKKNINDAILLLLFMLGFCLFLYFFNFLKLPDGLKWFRSQPDGFLVIVSLVAVVGAIWAILARVDAEKAFEEARYAQAYSDVAMQYAYDAYQQSVETRKSVADSFEFAQILDPNKLPSFYNRIGEKNTDIMLVLGFPCVGYFYDNDDFKQQSLDTFMILINQIKNLCQLSKDDFKFSFSIACFSRTLVTDYIDQSFAHGKLTLEQKEKVKVATDEFFDAIEKCKDKFKTKIHLTYLPKDMFLRYAVSHTAPPKRHQFDNNIVAKSIFWVVADFQEKSSTDFKSAGFISGDYHFSQTLQFLYGNFEGLRL